ncbi:hypothetical protein ABFV83_10140 [Lacrimispora sp. BS-2]|uniref:Transposase n=1 Tax=Lacrimispora sp. BS-2 TaxID=3151850 RepID=A0AAU7PWM0_9FIRM
MLITLFNYIIRTIHKPQKSKGAFSHGKDENREIEVTNQRLRQLKARISKLQNWLKEEMQNNAPPTLADVIQGILARREQSGKSDRYQAIGNLKAAAKMLNFLQQNQIRGYGGT